MTACDQDALLDQAWGPARKAGTIGSASTAELRAHARGFMVPAWRSARPVRLIDIGTGAGIPGLLVALELPESRWVLADADERRCRAARSAVRAVGLEHRVTVEHVRVESLAARSDAREGFDGATARSFGPVSELAECGLPLLRVGGELVVSVTEETERHWRTADLERATGCVWSRSWQTAHGRYLAVKRTQPAPEGLPRRAPSRRRTPLI